MKHTLLISLFISHAVLAQNPEEQKPEETSKKRPSWSQGLPERQKVLKPGTSALNIESTDRSEIEAPLIEQLQTEQPKFELEQLEVPAIEHKIKIDAPVLEQVEVMPTQRLGTHVKSQRRPLFVKKTNPLHEKYQWNVLRTTPIEMPSHLNNKRNIDVIIYIKPDGSVSKVTSKDPDVSSTMLKYVSDSIRNWVFDAPEKIGIQDILSKQFAIEIQS